MANTFGVPNLEPRVYVPLATAQIIDMNFSLRGTDKTWHAFLIQEGYVPPWP